MPKEDKHEPDAQELADAEQAKVQAALDAAEKERARLAKLAEAEG